MRRVSVVLLALLLLTAGPLAALERCAHSEPRTLVLDYAGVRSVHFVVGQHELRIAAAATPAAGISGHACASSADALGQLSVRQERVGEQLRVTLERVPAGSWSLFGSHYAYLKLQAEVPGNLPIEVDVGSGDAWINGVAALTARVGSGDLEARAVQGALSISVGSGDATLDGMAALTVDSIGSGDLEARDVRGAVTVGSIGSGDFELQGADGDVDIGSIGSGDAVLERVSGNVTVGSIGSGDLKVRDVGGHLSVRSKGSGGIQHQRVSGTVEVPHKR